MRIGSVVTRVVLAASLSLFGACGSGGTTISPIYQGLVSPQGGTVATNTVVLVLPPGWVAQSHAVLILPQPTPLPIDPLAGPVDYMPGLMCVGPVGLDLLVPAHIRFCYDPLTIPAGGLETDIVLLEWNEAAGHMKVSQTAVQDLVNHCFDDFVYGQLGHIGVGIRTGPIRNFVFQANTGPAPIRTQAAVPGFIDGSLVVADDNGDLAPLGLDNTADANLYIPSRNGQKVLFRWPDPDNEQDALRAVDVPTGAVDFDSDPSLNLLPYDPLFGWFPNAGHLFFCHRDAGAALEGPSTIDVFADNTIGGSLNTHLRDGPDFFNIKDARVSPNGARVLLRYGPQFGGPDRADVITTSTGNLLAVDLPVLPNGSSSPMPRWLPDSSGLTFIDAVGAVGRINADGTNVQTLYTGISPILDFSLAPGASLASPSTARCAYIRTTAPIGLQSMGNVSAPSTFFVVDVLAGTTKVEQDLGAVYGVEELAYHPNGQSVWCQLNSGNLGLHGSGSSTGFQMIPFGSFVESFSASNASTHIVIAARMGALDISRTTGEVLLWMQNDFQDAQFPTAGIWKLDADGLNGSLVPLPGFVPIGPPRLLASWRSNSCESYDPYVR
jgi:hypothetical protein